MRDPLRRRARLGCGRGDRGQTPHTEGPPCPPHPSIRSTSSSPGSRWPAPWKPSTAWCAVWSRARRPAPDLHPLPRPKGAPHRRRDRLSPSTGSCAIILGKKEAFSREFRLTAAMSCLGGRLGTKIASIVRPCRPNSVCGATHVQSLPNRSQPRLRYLGT